ncbi:MAG: L-aspartate oxidase [Planctomycetes bacterium]|nr:L-aspartate oxidase [Planctomycetota bacterium]
MMSSMLPTLRSLVDLRDETTELVRTDVLILGGGVAGFSAAIAAAPGARVLCVTKDTALSSNTHRAQGGVAAVLSDEDSTESHRDDTVTVGVGLCRSEAVELVVKEGPSRIRDLIEWGGNFDREGDSLHLTLEGGHSHKRVLHAQGDQTGIEVQTTLLRKVRSLPGTELWEHGFAIDLLSDGYRCVGAVVARGDRKVIVLAKAVILATGGAGQIYRETTNPTIATGDGFAMCIRAGVALRDMEFIQFHPTTLYIAGSARHLITEAVRGEGAFLRDMRGERFMVNYHPDAELAPRDVVSRSIMRHLAANGDGHVFLDLTHLGADFVRRRFPKLIETCGLFRLDASRDLIPIQPSAHYVMGGVEVDLDARSAMPGLYACGEVASSGLHGANRLASNSLLEGLVFGHRAGLHAAGSNATVPAAAPDFAGAEFSLEGSVINAPDMVNSIKSLMWKDVGIIRNAEGLKRAENRLTDWANYLMQCSFRDPEGWELVNSLMCAHAVAASARLRKESRGAHFRTDYTECDDEHWRRHSRYPFLDEDRP